MSSNFFFYQVCVRAKWWKWLSSPDSWLKIYFKSKNLSFCVLHVHGPFYFFNCSVLQYPSLLFSSLFSFHSSPLFISSIHPEVNMERNKLWSSATSRHERKWERGGKTARNASGGRGSVVGRDLLLNVSMQLSSEFYANFWKVPESKMWIWRASNSWSWSWWEQIG